MNAFKSAEKQIKSYSTWEEVLSQRDHVKDPHFPSLGMKTETVRWRGRETMLVSFEDIEDVCILVEALDLQ